MGRCHALCPQEFHPVHAACAAPLNSLEYAADYDITKALGGTTSTLRTPTQTVIAHFWSDLSGVSVTPPGHWNEIAEQQSQLNGLNVLQTARVFALLDIGLADAAIVCWGEVSLQHLAARDSDLLCRA